MALLREYARLLRDPLCLFFLLSLHCLEVELDLSVRRRGGEQLIGGSPNAITYVSITSDILKSARMWNLFADRKAEHPESLGKTYKRSEVSLE